MVEYPGLQYTEKDDRHEDWDRVAKARWPEMEARTEVAKSNWLAERLGK